MSDGFGIDHLPYGVYSTEGSAPRVGVRYGDTVVDAQELTGQAELGGRSLNAFLALGPEAWAEARAQLTRRVPSVRGLPLEQVTLHLPFEVGDYVDFYASLDHASNVGRIFRPDQEPLLPNWRHLPVGYHGRAGTVVVSGTPVIRPCGQRLPAGSSRGGPPTPEYGPSRRLDIEAELGFVVGVGSELGTRVGVDTFQQHVFGVVGLNDWSARDIQAWEYVPLGPFLGKSFATSVSAWVTPLAALEAAWCDLPGQDPRPLPYLVPTGSTDGARALDISVEVVLNGEVVSRPPYRIMYWSPAQMLAHLTVNGASTRPGDLFASGTISGPEPDTRGSFLELSWGGKEPFAGGRTFLEDGDEVTLCYSAPGTGGGRITLGEVTGRVEPARE
ncbi:MAG: fumarylacetoacetase [Nocardioides sp.]|nr:fumarylacetoacetase [Nocardioides sp.]